MPKKNLIAIIAMVVSLIAASLTLVFTVGLRVSADSAVETVDSNRYLNIENGVLKGFNDDGIARYKNDSSKKYRIEIPDDGTVTSIGDYAFIHCDGLTSIKIPTSVTSIGDYAFHDCNGFISIAIPESVTSIGDNAFYACSSLTSVNYLGTLDQWVNIDFSNESSNPVYSAKKLRIKTKEVIYGVLTDATTIKQYAFYNCRCLTSIIIPASVETIGTDVFTNCNKLEEIIVENPDLMNNANLQSYQSKMHVANCAVTFMSDGETCDTQDVAFGNCATAPTVTKDGHNFMGWYTDGNCTIPFDFSTPIIDNITLHAGWSINSYAVRFNADNGSDMTEQTIVYHQFATAPDEPVKLGHRFLGWYAENEDEQFDFEHTQIVANITLTAHWQINTYHVEFNSNNGTAVDTQNIVYNQVATEPEAPTRNGYTFQGWYLNDQVYDFTTPVTDNITLTASWEAIPEPEPVEEPESKVNVAAVAGGTAGGAVGLGTLGTLFGFAIRKRRRLK